MGRGLFITFEGGEGAGKTTLIESLSQFLLKQNKEVLRVREPGGTALGEKVRDLLLNPAFQIDPHAELCLFLASRSQQIQEVILPALNQNKVVLCDRFNDSSIVYQGYARGLGVEKVKEMCQFISDGVEPDLTFYLDLDPSLGLTRASLQREKDRIESEGSSFHQKIREGYLKIAQKEKKRFHLIDAKASKEEVYQQVLTILRKYV